MKERKREKERDTERERERERERKKTASIWEFDFKFENFIGGDEFLRRRWVFRWQRGYVFCHISIRIPVVIHSRVSIIKRILQNIICIVISFNSVLE